MLGLVAAGLARRLRDHARDRRRPAARSARVRLQPPLRRPGLTLSLTVLPLAAGASRAAAPDAPCSTVLIAVLVATVAQARALAGESPGGSVAPCSVSPLTARSLSPAPWPGARSCSRSRAVPRRSSRRYALAAPLLRGPLRLRARRLVARERWASSARRPQSAGRHRRHLRRLLAIPCSDSTTPTASSTSPQRGRTAHSPRSACARWRRGQRRPHRYLVTTPDRDPWHPQLLRPLPRTAGRGDPAAHLVYHTRRRGRPISIYELSRPAAPSGCPRSTAAFRSRAPAY